MSVPERYQRYAQPGQRPVEPTTVYQPQPVEVYEQRPPVAYVADLDNPGRSVAIDARLIQRPEPAAPRDLTPQPLFDPIAQRCIGAGVGGGVLLWGGGQFLVGAGQFVSGLTGMGALLFFLAIAGGRALLGAGRRGGTHIEVHNHVRGFGRSNTTL